MRDSDPWNRLAKPNPGAQPVSLKGPETFRFP